MSFSSIGSKWHESESVSHDQSPHHLSKTSSIQSKHCDLVTSDYIVRQTEKLAFITFKYDDHNLLRNMFYNIYFNLTKFMKKNFS